MNKIVTFIICNLLLTSAAIAAISSTVTLPGGGTIGPTNSANIALSNLISNANYNISCKVDTAYTDEIVRLSTNVDPIAYYTSPGTSNFTITSLDQDNDIIVSNCSAVAVS